MSRHEQLKRLPHTGITREAIVLPGNAVEGKSELLSACVEQDVGVMAMKILGGGKLLSPWDPGSFSRWQLGGDGRDPSTRRP